MYYVWTILKRDIRSFIPQGGKTGSKKAALLLLQIVAYLAFAGALGYGAFLLFDFVNMTFIGFQGLIDNVTVNILAGTALLAIFMVLVTGLQIIYKTVYESDDIGFLLMQPVPTAAVFASKFLTSYVYLFIIGAVFAIPPWIGWGVANGAGPLFYLYSILGYLLLLLLTHGIVTLLLLAAMRYIQGRKMKQLFIVSSALVGVVFVIASQMFSAKMGQMQNPSDMLQQISASQLAKTWYFPSTWMVNAVLGTYPRFGLNGTPYALALLGASVGVALLSLWVSGHWYLSGWAGRNEETGQRKRRSAKKHGASRRSLLGGLKGTYWSVLRKDLTVVSRDPIIWYSLVVAVITLGFFVFSTMRTVGAGSEDTNTKMGVLIVMMSAMMGSVSSCQTGGVSISREGQSFWLLRSNPTHATSLLWAKMTYALLPQFLVITLALVASHIFAPTGFSLWLGLLLGFSLAAVVASVQIMLDVTYPDFVMKIEFGSSKSGRGTGKVLASMFLSMGIAMVWMFLWQLPAILAVEGVFLGLPVESWNLVIEGLTVAVGVVMLIWVHIVGVRRITGLLRDA
jgi:hypothetical protein